MNLEQIKRNCEIFRHVLTYKSMRKTSDHIGVSPTRISQIFYTFLRYLFNNYDQRYTQETRPRTFKEVLNDVDYWFELLTKAEINPIVTSN